MSFKTPEARLRERGRVLRRQLLHTALVVLFGVCGATPGTSQTTAAQLTQISLEELMDVQVTSVSKKQQKLSDAGAAVSLLTAEDIRRSGATNVPDLLRTVPGVDVAQVDANIWAISIRGFNDIYADKVLVLVDGRSAYSHTFTGVAWDQIDVPLEDIDRIEVIRDPGGTVWGANAVNGVINIITKNARDTKGATVTADLGSRTAGGLVQYGGAIGSRGSYRVFNRYFSVSNSPAAGGGAATDGWHGFHEGFRTDWDLSPRDNLTVQGDFVQTGEGQTLPNAVSANALPLVSTINDRIKYGDGNLSGRWGHVLAGGSDISLQVYDDYYVRSAQGLREAANTLDLDFQHHLTLGRRHDIVWGTGYRVISDRFRAGYNVNFLPPHRTDNLYSAFLQDEIRLTDKLSLTIGTKLEHNAYTGFEFEPGAQLVWEMTKRQTVWASASRAIRQPARRDFGINAWLAFPAEQGGNQILELLGNPNPRVEQIRDFEAGHRFQISQRLSVDSVGFLSLYRDLATTEPSVPFVIVNQGRPQLIIPLFIGYTGRANNYGAEFVANWTVSRRWRLSPGFSLLHMHSFDSSGQGTTFEDPGNSPRHKFQVRSLVNLTRNVEWDTNLSSVAGITSTPGYSRLDTRLGWHHGEGLELSLAGQNLLTPKHAEFADQYGVAHTLVERSIFVKITWHY